MTQTVTITGKKLADDDLTLIVGDRAWAGWTDVRVTRGIERATNDFQIAVTERYADGDVLAFKPGDPCEVWVGRRSRPTNRVLTGFLNRYAPSIAPGQHSVTITGRGRCQDLVDCSAEWPGQQIVGASVLEVAQKLAAPFGITVAGELGPTVGKGTLIPLLNLMQGESPWEIIERLCRIAGLLAFEQPDGSLLLLTDPGNSAERVIRELANIKTAAATGFAEGVNVSHAAATFSDDQRFHRYRTFVYSFDPFKELRAEPDPIATALDTGVTRYRPRDIVAEMGHALAYDVATLRARWEAARRRGRAQVVQITTDSWRDGAGDLYTPNTLAALDLPSLKIVNALWLISEVTYRKSEAGTQCDLTLMPPEACSVQPTLPQSSLPWEFSSLPREVGRQ